MTPQIIPADESYLDPEALRALQVELGLSTPDLARFLQVSRPAVYYYLDGARDPYLNTYLRMCALSRKPVGSFLRRIGPSST